MKLFKDMTDDEKEARRGEFKRATERAKECLKPGDRVSRTMCGGSKGTFTFTRWEGTSACGKTIDDCPASAIYAVNGKHVCFLDTPEVSTYGK